VVFVGVSVGGGGSRDGVGGGFYVPYIYFSITNICCLFFILYICLVFF